MSLMMLVSLLCFAVSAADIPEPSEDFYVYDEANVIDKATEESIIDQNDRLFYSTGAQIVIAAVKTTGDTSIRDYAGEMFNEWGIGDGEKNNGVLVLLAIDDDDYWVTQGSGIEDKLTSGDIKVMLDNLLEPSFAAKDYDQGVSSLFAKLITTFEGIYDVKLSEVLLPEGGIDHHGNVQAKAGGGFAGVILTLLVIVVVVVVFIVIVMVISTRLPGGRGYHRPTVHIPPMGRRHPPHRPGPGMGNRPGMGPRPGMGRPSGMGPRPSGPRPGAGRPGGMGGRPSGGGARPRSGGGGRSRGGGAGRR